MHFYLLGAAALALAVLFWYIQAVGARKNEGGPEGDPGEAPRWGRDEAAKAADALSGAVDALEGLMEHPTLGGPGFMTVRFSAGRAAVCAQYPNIREGLYRRIAEGELSEESLRAAGVGEALLKLKPAFETESGGVVLVTADAAEVGGGLAACLDSQRERRGALEALARELGRRKPGFSVRVLGADLMLSPRREDRESENHTFS